MFQTTALRNWPLNHQLAHKPATLLGMTQDKSNQLNTTYHRQRAVSQWRNKWSMLSSSDLQKQHLLITIRFFFLRLSIIRIFLNTAVHAKKATLGGVLVRQMLFQRKWLTLFKLLPKECSDHFKLFGLLNVFLIFISNEYFFFFK